MAFPHRPVAEEIHSPRPHLGAQRAARESDAVIALGGGYLTDSDKAQTRRVLNLFDHAVEHGVPVVMLGQGIGPMVDSALLEQCSRTLPRLRLIAVREPRRSPALLHQMGVIAERVLVTGDDAIELAHGESRDDMGRGVGVCLRVAGYSPVDDAVRDVVGQVVRAVAAEHDAPLVPLIIAEYRNQDRRSTLPIVRNAPAVVPPLGRYVPARAVAARVSDCAVLVTGAYHLAVFALSQGIPVVAITSSEYYDDKFLGLGEMFEQGVTLVRLDDPALSTVLREAIETAWTSAETVRAPLRARAQEQIGMSRRAFDRVHDVIEQAVTGRA